MKLALIATVGAVTYYVMMRRYRQQYPTTVSFGHRIDYLVPQSEWISNAGHMHFVVEKVDDMYVYYRDSQDFQHRLNPAHFLAQFEPARG